MRPTRTAILSDGTAPDTEAILAPTVGRWLSPPPVGTHVTAGSPVGELRILARIFRLVAPKGVDGIVTEYFTRAPAVVERGQPLLAIGHATAVAGEKTGPRREAAAEEGIPEGMLAVRCPTDGIFYRRPAPDEPQYVAEGEEIEAGRVLGLVEVMKCFNQIVWRPEDGPTRAKVAKILAADSAEVKLDEALFLLDPAC